MQIEYEPNLVEQAVFLLARRDRTLERELHAATDSLYAVPNARQREAKFREAYSAFFSRFRLDSILPALLDERPLIAKRVGKCLVREAPRKKTESAELFVKGPNKNAEPSDRTLIIQVCPQSLLAPEPLAAHMRREFLHVADMLDDEFQYAPESLDCFSPKQNLIRDRYRVLWDIYAESRLHRQGLSDEPTTTRLETMFHRAFGFQDAGAGRDAFSHAFHTTRLTHRQLLDWAEAPETLFANVAQCQTFPRQGPGAACPLCAFPTHDWFSFDSDAEGTLAEAIRSDYPNWSMESGACRQCAELYASAVTHSRTLRVFPGN